MTSVIVFSQKLGKKSFWQSMGTIQEDLVHFQLQDGQPMQLQSVDLKYKQKNKVVYVKLLKHLPRLIFCMIVETISFHTKGNVDGINKDSIQLWAIQSVQKGIVVDFSSFFDMFCVSHAQSCRLSKFSMGCCIDNRSPLNKRFQR